MSTELDKETGQIYEEDHKEFCVEKYLAIRSTSKSERDALRQVQIQFKSRFKEDVVPDVERLTRWIRDHDANMTEGGPTTRTRQSRRAAAEAAKKLIEISSDSDEDSEPEIKRSRPSKPSARGRPYRREASPQDEEYNPHRDNLTPATSLAKRSRTSANTIPALMQRSQMYQGPPQARYSVVGQKQTVPNVTIVQGGHRTQVATVNTPGTSRQMTQPIVTTTLKSLTPESSRESALIRQLKDSKISKPLMAASLSLLRAVETTAKGSNSNVADILKKVMQAQSASASSGQAKPSSPLLSAVRSAQNTVQPQRSLQPQRPIQSQRPNQQRPIQARIIQPQRPIPPPRAYTVQRSGTAPRPSLLQMVRESLAKNPQLPMIRLPSAQPTVLRQTRPAPTAYPSTSFSLPQVNPVLKTSQTTYENKVNRGPLQPTKNVLSTPSTQTTISDLERKIYEGIISLKGISLDMDCEEIVNSDDEEEVYSGNHKLREKPGPSGHPKPEYVVDPDGETGSLDMSCEEIQAEPLELYCHRDKLSEIQIKSAQKDEAAYKYYVNTKNAYEKMGASFTIMDSSKAQQLNTGGSNVRVVQQLTNQPVKTSHPVYLQPPPGSSSKSPLILPAGSYIIQVPAGGQLPGNQTFFTRLKQ